MTLKESIDNYNRLINQLQKTQQLQQKATLSHLLQQLEFSETVMQNTNKRLSELLSQCQNEALNVFTPIELSIDYDAIERAALFLPDEQQEQTLSIIQHDKSKRFITFERVFQLIGIIIALLTFLGSINSSSVEEERNALIEEHNHIEEERNALIKEQNQIFQQLVDQFNALGIEQDGSN